MREGEFDVSHVPFDMVQYFMLPMGVRLGDGYQGELDDDGYDEAQLLFADGDDA